MHHGDDRPPRSGPPRVGSRTVAVVTASATLAVGAAVAAAVAWAPSHRAGAEQPLVATIRPGDCVLDPVENVYRTADGNWHMPGFSVVPCAQPHFGEAYAVTSSQLAHYDSWDAYSGADAACRDAFEGFVGAPYADSTLSYEAYYPTEESWGEGDRAVMCVVYGSADLVGTVAASGR